LCDEAKQLEAASTMSVEILEVFHRFENLAGVFLIIKHPVDTRRGGNAVMAV
jgi:hypothetical protein